MIFGSLVPCRLTTIVSRRRASLGSTRSSFTFAGPRQLYDVVKEELIKDLPGKEVADIWYTYHETKDNVIGLVLNGNEGKTVLSRASSCPFFIQPVFREKGFFTLLSQFQSPCHFLIAYLEDYKMDAHAASPLLTFSLFDDYAESKDLALIRCDVLNRSIEDEEARKVVNGLLQSYYNEEDFATVKMFNKGSSNFDVTAFVMGMKEKWDLDDSVGSWVSPDNENTEDKK